MKNMIAINEAHVFLNGTMASVRLLKSLADYALLYRRLYQYWFGLEDEACVHGVNIWTGIVQRIVC